MESAEVEECFEVAMRLVKEAGKVVREAIKKQKTIEMKSCNVDLVTESDKAVEKLLIVGLSQAFPAHKFIGEESTAAGAKCVLTEDPTWIIDPIDGTMNFVHSLPYTCISVGLWAGRAGVLGIVYNPILEQMFTAKKGCGAYLNGERIYASGCKDLSQALVFAEMGTSHDPEKVNIVLTNLTTLMPRVHGIRGIGSAALGMASVAAGWGDAFYHQGLHCWDTAAAALMLTEAGGIRDYGSAVLTFSAVAAGWGDLCFSSGTLGPWDMAAGVLLITEAGGVVCGPGGGIRAMGSCALNLCMVACGGVEVTFEYGIHAWDTAAAVLIVTEAGGVATDTAGGPFDLMRRRVLCAATPELAEQVAGLLKQYQPTPDGDLLN